MVFTDGTTRTYHNAPTLNPDGELVAILRQSDRYQGPEDYNIVIYDGNVIIETLPVMTDGYYSVGMVWVPTQLSLPMGVNLTAVENPFPLDPEDLSTSDNNG